MPPPFSSASAARHGTRRLLGGISATLLAAGGSHGLLGGGSHRVCLLVRVVGTVAVGVHPVQAVDLHQEIVAVAGGGAAGFILLGLRGLFAGIGSLLLAPLREIGVLQRVLLGEA